LLKPADIFVVTAVAPLQQKIRIAMGNDNVRYAWLFRFWYQGGEPEVVQTQRTGIDGNFPVACLY